MQRCPWRGLDTCLFGYNIAFGIVPIVLSPWVLIWARRIPAQLSQLLWILWLGAVTHFVYIGLYTRFDTDFYWYYVEPVVLLGLIMGAGLRELDLRYRLQDGRFWRGWRGRVGATIAGAGVLAAFATISIHCRWTDQIYERSPKPAIADFIRAENLHQTGILVADYPGTTAFCADNCIVAADMLTANCRLYREVVSSPNALKALLSYCRQRGRPIE